MKSIIKFLFLLLATPLATPLEAQNNSQAGTSFNLQQAIDYAIKNGYSVKNAATDIEIANKKVQETRGIGIPQLRAEAGYQNFLEVPVSLIPATAFAPQAPEGTYLRVPFGIQHNLNYGYTASWLAFSGEYFVGLQATRTYLEISKSALRKTEIQVKESVINAYYTNLILAENKRILSENINNLQASIKQTSAFNEEGFVEALDVDRLKLLESNLKNTLNTLEQQKSLAEKLLKFQMGYDVNLPITLTETLETVLAVVTAETSAEPKFDLNSNIDFQMLNNSYKFQQLNYKRLRANYLPTVSTFYSWKESRLNNDFSGLTDPNFRVPGGTVFGLNVSLPIFQGFSQRARVQQARLDLNKLEVQKQQQEQGYMLQSAQSLTDFTTSVNNFKQTKESVQLAERIRSQSDTKYKEGVGSSIEVIQAQNELLNAQSNYINAVMQMLNARLSLDIQLNKF